MCCQSAVFNFVSELSSKYLSMNCKIGELSQSLERWIPVADHKDIKQQILILLWNWEMIKELKN